LIFSKPPSIPPLEKGEGLLGKLFQNLSNLNVNKIAILTTPPAPSRGRKTNCQTPEE
jgi:hypothetical protein